MKIIEYGGIPMKKRLVSLLCALLLLCGAVPAASALEGEALQAAKTLTALHLLDSVPSAKALKTPAARVRATELLVRLYGVTSATRDVSPQEYAAAQGWVTVTSDQQEPVPTAEFCASLLRQLGYKEGFDNENAALFARRAGLLARDYGDTLTLGELYELVRDALPFPDAEGVSAAQRLVDKGICTQADIQGLFPQELTARQVADRHMAAVFRLDTYRTEKQYEKDQSDNGGSGFFVTAGGLAVTNYHTIKGSSFATVTLVTGETFPVEKVLFYDIDADLALLRVSQTTRDGKTTAPFFSFLEIAEDPDLRPGDQVYTMGVPLGITLAISDGVISAVNHQAEGFTLPCVINTADISHGSSGGVLMNIYGRVVGVTTGAYSSGNNLYLSVPLTPVLEADWTVEGITLAEVLKEAVARETGRS